MKILHYIPSIDRSSGGVGAYMQLLAKELGRMVDLHIVAHRSEDELPIDNVQIHYIEQELLRIGEAKGQFCGLLDTICPDVVHSNCCWQPHCALVVSWAHAKGYKVVLTPHGMLEPWIMQRHYWTKKWPALMLYQRKAIETADVIHATADSEKNNLILNSQFSILNSRVTVIPNGINVEAIEMKQSWKRTGNILFLSRVHPKKGINFLIEAAAKLKEELQGYTFTIAGESFGNYVDELHNIAVQYGVDDMFRFVGGVYGDDKWELYNKADLFVLPTHSENFGIVVAEALASGTPVITTQGAPWEELETSHCGWWTAIGTKPTVAALRQFLSLTEKELEMMGCNGRRLVETKYSAQAVARQFVEMYENMCAIPHHPDKP